MAIENEVLTRRAGVAQSVEQLIRNQQVAGSNPVTSSKSKKDTVWYPFYFWKVDVSGEKLVRPSCDGLSMTDKGFVAKRRTIPSPNGLRSTVCRF